MFCIGANQNAVTGLFVLENQDALYFVQETDEKDLCVICYANAQSATFIPCQHKSCRYSSFFLFLSLKKRVVIKNCNS